MRLMLHVQSKMSYVLSKKLLLLVIIPLCTCACPACFLCPQSPSSLLLLQFGTFLCSSAMMKERSTGRQHKSASINCLNSGTTIAKKTSQVGVINICVSAEGRVMPCCTIVAQLHAHVCCAGMHAPWAPVVQQHYAFLFILFIME